MGGTSTRPWSCSDGSTMPSSRRRLGRSTLLWKKFSVGLFFLIFFPHCVYNLFHKANNFAYSTINPYFDFFLARVRDKILGSLWLICRLGKQFAYS
ncbi:putative serine/threonine-protein phosphatase 2A regulatory subunit B'' subunit TON2 isoform X2 [Iris pallida]|uniref:Serine/threonine-protein phosphatase 2A regulatory subunit B'' subunit TON2 isoform X2 n=1 Tax=Iris pallida TaxID=29817 RepID=A0AAX6H6M0_IRIPA|nr:putative serine/threonine-protein phosphatase 2A regulatory subunit B'' subunit TON2 isoform X2 [Iris pallida]